MFTVNTFFKNTLKKDWNCCSMFEALNGSATTMLEKL